MEITEVKVIPAKEKAPGRLLAFASIVFDNSFMVKGLRLVKGVDGYFVAMPDRRQKHGGFADIAHPVNRRTRDHIEQAVIDEYLKVTKGRAA